MQDEQTLEGKALLRLYSSRAQGLESSRRVQQAEGQVAVLQAASCSCSSQLSKLHVALSNMYNIARSYQRSLPPPPSLNVHSMTISKVQKTSIGKQQGPFQKKNVGDTARHKAAVSSDSNSGSSDSGSSGCSTASKLLESLHNFLQDASTAVTMAQEEQRPDSTRPTLGSI